MEADNVLADDMDAGGPEFTPFFGIIWKTNGGDIGSQRIEPDIHDMVLAAWNLDAPVKAGARDGQVFQPAFYKFDCFIFTALGAHELWVGRVIIQQRLFIFGQPEKPAFFNRPLNRCALGGQLLAPFPIG